MSGFRDFTKFKSWLYHPIIILIKFRFSSTSPLKNDASNFQVANFESDYFSSTPFRFAHSSRKQCRFIPFRSKFTTTWVVNKVSFTRKRTTSKIFLSKTCIKNLLEIDFWACSTLKNHEKFPYAYGFSSQKGVENSISRDEGLFPGNFARSCFFTRDIYSALQVMIAVFPSFFECLEVRNFDFRMETPDNSTFPSRHFRKTQKWSYSIGRLSSSETLRLPRRSICGNPTTP